MSEYQYYEFRTVDRALNKAELADLRAISSRAVITPSGFTNHYQWGDLKADPRKLLERHFDAYLYLANRGTRRFCLRMPGEQVDTGLFRTLLPGRSCSMRHADTSVVVEFENELEYSGHWVDGTGWMDALLPLRSAVLLGDLRCLYLAWLLSAQKGEISADAIEPEVPDGLNELPAALESFLEFLEIDQALVKVAAAASAPLKFPSDEELAAWVSCLTGEEKEDLLIAAISQPGEVWKVALRRRLQDRLASGTLQSSLPRRSAGDLLAQSRILAEERERQRKAQREAEAAEKRAREAAERANYLDHLSTRENEVWKLVAKLIEERKVGDYGRVTVLLTDLRDLAIRHGRGPAFRAALDRLLLPNPAKGAFQRRLQEAQLWSDAGAAGPRTGGAR